jgi:hypothetical protein
MGLTGNFKLVEDFPLPLFVAPVGETFQEEQGQDVTLIGGGGNTPPQDVSGLPQVALQLRRG